ncbi:MAG TPA: metal ABC transporter permease [candidate division Zixibacteria bacterium]|nr:metal ABC transporter permease [candidate division Zixibacteria bacterium]
MTGFLAYLDPSHLLFPALLASAVLAVVFPLLGTQLILRRALFLGLTLPQIAAAGVAFAFWVQQSGFAPAFQPHHRSLGLGGSLLFTLLGMGISAFLEQRGGGSTEARLAAAYAFAGALTILFIVFNPAGEVEILSMLKGEVIALSPAEVRILIGVFAAVLFCLILFRREFLLTAFDRDLAFLLKGGSIFWTLVFYSLAGISIAVGVIMAGPLLIFGLMVLPPLAARPLVQGMTVFLWSSSLLGLLIAVGGFYASVILDLPLGPTDVVIGCLAVFASHGLKRLRIRASVASVVVCLLAAGMNVGCAPLPSPPFPEAALGKGPVWLSPVKNATPLELRLPSGNPFQSLAEMAGKGSPASRATVMELLRAAVQSELQRRGISASLPELFDARLSDFPAAPSRAAETARRAGLSGTLLLGEIRRWRVEPRGLTSVAVDWTLVRIADGALLWRHEIRRAISGASAAHAAEAHRDAIRVVVAELFAPQKAAGFTPGVRLL